MHLIYIPDRETIKLYFVGEKFEFYFTSKNTTSHFYTQESSIPAFLYQ